MTKYHLYFSQRPNDIHKAQEFRGRLFRHGAIDIDELDQKAVHGLIHDRLGRLVCVFRMLPIHNHEDFETCYSSQYYDLEGVKGLGGNSLELGRFCIAPDVKDPDVVRLAWAELAKYAIENNIDLLFGCSSFHGVEIEKHAEALSLLKERYLAPKKLLPTIKAPKVFEFAKKFHFRKPNLKIANQTMPPLLRSYLMLGGWVSDHAVIDHDLNTIHVFTGVEVKRIPQAKRNIFLRLIKP